MNLVDSAGRRGTATPRMPALIFRLIILPVVTTSLVALLLAGCVAQQGTLRRDAFVTKPLTPPPIRYCFDHVGHQAGAKPFIYGGTCVCTPTAERLAAFQRLGYFKGMSVAEVVRLYAQQGIKTAAHHQECNNGCQWGPHIVKGGHCMVPPTPGTRNFEEVLSGRFVPVAKPREASGGTAKTPASAPRR